MRVLCQLWEESEAGWGVRPDGYSLHKTQEDVKAYIEDHSKFLVKLYGNTAPHEYDRPSGKPYPCEVSQEVYGSIKGHGQRSNDRNAPKEVKKNAL